MKRLLAIILTSLFILSVFTGCGSSEVEEEIKGAEISMFLTTLPESIDPSASYASPDDIRIMGLLYEGLTAIGENGKLENALAKRYEYDFNIKTGNLELIIELENSRWSDGNLVTSEDFRFAWLRILKPEFNSPSASLLYPILNAKNAKEGNCSIDDVGIVCQDTKTLMITFEKSFANEDDYSKGEVKSKVENFMRRLASPALVPLRQDVVDDDTHDWCQANGTTYVTNGPFKIKAWNTGELTFERSVNYRCVGDNDGNADDKLVRPYKISTKYYEGLTAEDHYEKYKNGEINYINLNSASDETVKELSKSVEKAPLYSTYCLYLDINHEVLSDAKVRQALSMALDRTAIAKGVNGAPATGFVPTGVDDTDEKSDFRKKGGDLVSATPNIEAAKKLLKEAGIDPKGKIIAIDVSNRREDDAFIVAEVVKAWKELGFTVRINSVTQGYINKKNSGEFEFDKNNTKGVFVYASVLAVNLQSTTPDAFSILTSFSGEYGGKAIDVRAPMGEYTPHVTGFFDAEYDKLCGEFVNAKDAKTAAAAMHKAEEYLVNQMPAIPVVFNYAYYATQDLSDFEIDAFGRLNFTKLNLETYSEKAEREALKAKAEEAAK